ncbi:MAG: histidine phosphatase family protein [Chloroflexi bacterium]|nr:histidine phosphatase family protein [Chloroflexota bacterium]
MTRLILVRHGETHWNQQGRVQGHSDTSLNATGKQQAELVAAALAREELAAVYSSPLQRALETARAIARRHHLPVVAVPDLQEMHLGRMDGLSLDEMRRDHARFFLQWRQGSGSLKMPGGESMEEVQARAWPAIEHVLERHPGQTAAVVSHNFVIMGLICRALDMKLSNFRRLRPATGGITVLDFKDGLARLARFNDTCHLGKA